VFVFLSYNTTTVGAGCTVINSESEYCDDVTIAPGASATVTLPITISAADGANTIAAGDLTDASSEVQVRADLLKAVEKVGLGPVTFA
jgi:hypothetical protein